MSTLNVQENEDCIYFTIVSKSNNQIDSTPILTYMNETGLSPQILLSDYNLYLTSLNLSISELPYFNIKKSIIDFTLNKTNMTISFISNNPADRNFNLNGNTNLLLEGIGNNTGTAWQGVVCYLQYVGENSNPTKYPNPPNTGGSSTQYYPYTYFNVHSINQVIDMINTALTSILNVCTLGITKTFYISYDPNSELYTFNVHDNVAQLLNTTMQFYVNGFLERILDSFRWQFFSHTNMQDVPYQGLSFKFIPTLSNLNQKNANDIWQFVGEYSCITNLIDIVSVVVVSEGSMAGIRKEYIPVNEIQTTTTYLPSKPVLKNLDILLSQNLAASSNNSNIVYESQTLDRPINCYSARYLTDISFRFFYTDIENNLIEILQPSISNSNIKFCLKKLKK